MQFTEGLGLLGAWTDENGNAIFLKKGETKPLSKSRAEETLRSLTHCTNTIDCEFCDNCHDAIGLKNEKNKSYVYKSNGKKTSYDSWLEFLEEDEWYVVVYPISLYKIVPDVKDEETARQLVISSHICYLSNNEVGGFFRGRSKSSDNR
ncbi:MAG TPA: hypothetical protein DCL21_06920 [Alphaproteobacteria bacterium]|nr:hypothetical protein [Alphaproteobacteria bacterium]